jgi:S-adenosylmethionine-dependent methyltransferase
VSDGFEGSVPTWTAQLSNARNVVRQQLVERQLFRHIEELEPGSRVVDVGCGQGTIAVALAQKGFRVLGVDPSTALLARARAASAGLDVSFVEGTLDDLDTLAPKAVDAVCCHGVVMYLPELEPAVERLVGPLRPGGLLSLLTRNQAGIAFRAGMTGNWTEALSSFDATHYDNRVGVRGARADPPEAVIAACEAVGATVQAWYGVRVFTDHWGDVPPPAEIADIVALEDQAGRREPYRRLAALTHVIARRA